MTVSNATVLGGYFNTMQALGDKSISSDAYFEIEGHEDLALLTKQFPWPLLGVGGEIEVPGPMGSMMWQPQQLKTALQGQLGFSETVNGRVQRFLDEVVARGGYFNATVYEGTPDAFHTACKIKKCFFQPDLPDRDWENRSQVTSITGTLFFHYFGQKLPGNIVI
jgi:hypothetical protein